MKVILYNVESSPLFRWFLVALMMNFKEKPGRSLHIISCHHHTRFSSTTATECLLFVCLVCKSRSQSRPPRKTHRAIKVCKFCSDSMVTQNIYTWNPSRHSFFFKAAWGLRPWQLMSYLKFTHSPYGRVRQSTSCLKLISYLLPVHHMAESGQVWAEAHKLALTCSP